MTTEGAAVDASKAFMATANRLPTLFDLDDRSYELLTLLEEMGGEGTEEIEVQLALIDQLMIEKIEGYVSVIRTLEVMAEMRKAEADRLKARSAAAQGHADWLRNRILLHMQTAGRDRIEVAKFTLAIRVNNPSVKVLDAAAIPSEFQRTHISIEPNKTAILAHTKATGEVVAGTEIVRTIGLRIS